MSETYGTPNGEPFQGLAYAVAAAIAAIVAITLISSCVEEPYEAPAPDPAIIKLDTSNAALMHMHGMPTKEDVVNWHVTGQWGYVQDGRVRMFDELPGGSDRWDELYNIEENPAYRK